MFTSLPVASWLWTRCIPCMIRVAIVVSLLPSSAPARTATAHAATTRLLSKRRSCRLRSFGVAAIGFPDHYRFAFLKIARDNFSDPAIAESCPNETRLKLVASRQHPDHLALRLLARVSCLA